MTSDGDESETRPPSDDSRVARSSDDAGADRAAIAPAAPPEFGLTQVWWGPGKGKTTAALGMGLRAAGHGYRVHCLQFMKGGADSVEDVRGEFAAIDAVPGFTVERTGEYGWHGFSDGSEDDDHAARARAALARAREVVDGARDRDLTAPIPLADPPGDGVHMLILDEVGYAVNRDLLDPEAVRRLVEDRPDDLELVLTGGHERPTALTEPADLVSRVDKERHPIDAGQGARRGTEY